MCVCRTDTSVRLFGPSTWLDRLPFFRGRGLLLPLSTTVVDCVFEGRRLSQSFMCVPLGVCVCVCVAARIRPGKRMPALCLERKYCVYRRNSNECVEDKRASSTRASESIGSLESFRRRILLLLLLLLLTKRAGV